MDLIDAEDSGYERVEDRNAIATVWEALPERERKVLELRFMSDLTQREIGERLGYSRCTSRASYSAPSGALRTPR